MTRAKFQGPRTKVQEPGGKREMALRAGLVASRRLWFTNVNGYGSCEREKKRREDTLRWRHIRQPRIEDTFHWRHAALKANQTDYRNRLNAFYESNFQKRSCLIYQAAQ